MNILHYFSLSDEIACYFLIYCFSYAIYAKIEHNDETKRGTIMENLEQKIGQKAKNLRKEKNITLKELSEQTNLSVGYLSQFERGINTIAIDSLCKIADVYGVELNYFFPNSALEETKSPVMKSYEQTILDVIGNDYIVKPLTGNAPDHKIYPRIIEILPQVGPEKVQPYGHKGEEFIYVLEGILTLLLNEQRHLLYPGDSAHYKSTDNHNWTNETNKMVKLLCVSTPNPFNRDFTESQNLEERHL